MVSMGKRKTKTRPASLLWTADAQPAEGEVALVVVDSVSPAAAPWAELVVVPVEEAPAVLAVGVLVWVVVPAEVVLALLAAVVVVRAEAAASDGAAAEITAEI